VCVPEKCARTNVCDPRGAGVFVRSSPPRPPGRRAPPAPPAPRAPPPWPSSARRSPSQRWPPPSTAALLRPAVPPAPCVLLVNTSLHQLSHSERIHLPLNPPPLVHAVGRLPPCHACPSTGPKYVSPGFMGGSHELRAHTAQGLGLPPVREGTHVWSLLENTPIPSEHQLGEGGTCAAPG